MIFGVFDLLTTDTLPLITTNFKQPGTFYNTQSLNLRKKKTKITYDTPEVTYDTLKEKLGFVYNWLQRSAKTNNCFGVVIQFLQNPDKFC